MPAATVAAPQSRPYPLGAAMLAVRAAAGRLAEMGAKALLRLRKNPALQRVIAGVRALHELPRPERLSRLAAAAVGLLDDARAEDRPGAEAFLASCLEQDRDPAIELASKAMRLIARVDRIRQGNPARQRRATAARALVARQGGDQRQALRFALGLRAPLIEAAGEELVWQNASTTPALRSTMYEADPAEIERDSALRQRHQQAIERVFGNADGPPPGTPPPPDGPPDPVPPDAAEAKAATRRMIWGDVDPLEAEVEWQGRKVKGKDLPWMHPDWRPDFGWVSGPGIVRAPDDPYAPKSAHPLPEPPEPPPEPTEAEREATLARLDLAIEYRPNQRPPARNLPAQRQQMLTVALDHWSTAYDLACAIRDGRWWPPPAGYRLHPPEAPTEIPP